MIATIKKLREAIRNAKRVSAFRLTEYEDTTAVHISNSDFGYGTIIEWVNDNVSGGWKKDGDIWWFDNHDDAMLCYMRFR